MKWALVMMAIGTTPIHTNLLYDDLQACYALKKRSLLITQMLSISGSRRTATKRSFLPS
jgi:hypothetical protein